MSRPQDYPGNTAVQERPAGFFVRRRLTLNLANFNRVQPRADAGWFDVCFQLDAAQKAAAAARGELKRLEVRLLSGMAISIAENQAPGDQQSSADANARIVRTDWSNQQGVIDWFWATDGAVVVEVELWFDIPPASAV